MSPFAQWVGRPVILQVTMDNAKSALEGKIVSDAPESLHFQAQNARRILIVPKSCVLAVEEAPRTNSSRSRQSHWEMQLAS